MIRDIKELEAYIITYLEKCEKEAKQQKEDTTDKDTSRWTVNLGMEGMCILARNHVQSAFFQYNLFQEAKKTGIEIES